jgi:hypothetical protein
MILMLRAPSAGEVKVDISRESATSILVRIQDEELGQIVLLLSKAEAVVLATAIQEVAKEK